MGKPRRHAPQRQISDIHCLHHRHLHSGAPAQPPVYPRHSAGGLLQEVEEHHRQRLAHSPADIICHSRSYPVWTGTGIHRGFAILRTILRQRSRNVVQHRSAHLRHSRCCRIHLDHQLPVPTDQPADDQDFVHAQHTPLRHTIHWRQSSHSIRHNDSPGHLPLRRQEAADTHTQPHGYKHTGHIHRLLILCPAAHTLIGTHPHEPECARQRIRPQLLPQPRAVR